MNARIICGLSSSSLKMISSRTSFGSASHTRGAYARAVVLTIASSMRSRPFSITRENSSGSMREKTSCRSMSLVVIRCTVLAAICAALAGMMPCQPKRPNGEPSGCHKRGPKNSIG